ncbi:MAG: DUF4349 domain-containing protein [Cytophagales bacterium]
MRTKLCISLFTILIFSCNKSQDNASYESPSQSRTDAQNFSSAEASLDAYNNAQDNEQSLIPEKNSGNLIFTYVPSLSQLHKDSNRFFIKTANMRFRVKNVLESTKKIEVIVNEAKGFYTSSGISTNVQNVEIIPISKDSVLETTTYVISNNMTLRVPARILDSTLYEIGKYIDFLDYKNINAEDISRRLRSLKLSEKRNQELSERLLKLGKNPSKTSDGLSVEEALAKKLEQRDENQLDQWDMKDQVEFSTINLNIYQRETTHRTIFENPKNIKKYEPNFFLKLWDSIVIGWETFQSFILFVFKIWPFIILIVLSYLLFKKKETIKNLFKK